MPQPDGVLPHDPGGARGERPLLAVGRRQPFSRGAGPHVAPIDHTPAHHQRQGRLHIGQGGGVRRERTPARRLRGPRERPGRDDAAGAEPPRIRQGAVRQRLSRSGDRRAADLPVALPPGCVALPRGPRLAARAAAPRLGGFQSGRGAGAAPVAPHRAAGGWHGALDGALQGLRTHVRTLRRAALHRGIQRVGHRLQDRQVEYLAARQLVPALRRDDARQYGGQRSRSPGRSCSC